MNKNVTAIMIYRPIVNKNQRKYLKKLTEFNALS